jgi:hypothetical protein
MKASDFQRKPQTSAAPVQRAFFDRNPETAFSPSRNSSLTRFLIRRFNQHVCRFRPN